MLENPVTYIPEVDGNRERSEEDQWSVKLQPMTAKEQREYMIVVSGVKAGKDQVVKAQQVLGRIFRDRVLEVHNLADICGNPITNGEELYDNSETEYIDEIWEALTKSSQLRGGLKKS
jgi:hypothetical protein